MIMGHPQSMSRMHIQKLKIIVWVVQTELWINTEELIDIKSIINTQAIKKKYWKKEQLMGHPVLTFHRQCWQGQGFHPQKISQTG